jgi:hypothetical protein
MNFLVDLSGIDFLYGDIKEKSKAARGRRGMG